jgi:hypothetical protein
MKGHTRDMEGDNEQRRRAARDARAQGKRPSEAGATLGASKQREDAKRNAPHQSRVESAREGKGKAARIGRARPGNREVDPSRGRGG